MGARYVRIVTAVGWSYVMSFVFLAFLQAVKRPVYGFYESIFRKIIIPTGVFYLLVRVYDVGLSTFWWSSVVINILIALITFIYGWTVLRRLTKV